MAQSILFTFSSFSNILRTLTSPVVLAIFTLPYLKCSEFPHKSLAGILHPETFPQRPDKNSEFFPFFLMFSSLACSSLFFSKIKKEIKKKIPTKKHFTYPLLKQQYLYISSIFSSLSCSKLLLSVIFNHFDHR